MLFHRWSCLSIYHWLQCHSYTYEYTEPLLNRYNRESAEPKNSSSKVTKRLLHSKEFLITFEWIGTKHIRTLSLRIHIGSKKPCDDLRRTQSTAPSDVKGSDIEETHSNSNSSTDRYSIKRRFNLLLSRRYIIESVTSVHCLTIMSIYSNKRFSDFSREHKAAKTIGIVFGCFLICWLPFMTTITVYVLTDLDLQKPNIFMSIAYWLGYVNSGMNPIIYYIWSREYRRAFNRIFRRTNRTNMKRSSFVFEQRTTWRMSDL